VNNIVGDLFNGSKMDCDTILECEFRHNSTQQTQPFRLYRYCLWLFPNMNMEISSKSNLVHVNFYPIHEKYQQFKLKLERQQLLELRE